MTATHLTDEPRERRGSLPTRMHHNAYVTTDMEATRHFYEDVIGLPHTMTWAEVDELPDRTRVYCHTFFELDDGSALAFFQFANLEGEAPLAPQPSNSVHLALKCDKETQDGIYERLLAEGYTENEIIFHNHGYCNSLYIRDPNGLRLEFTVDHPDFARMAPAKRESARADLVAWLAGDHTSNNPYR